MNSMSGVGGITDAVLASASAHAIEAYPEEACGLVLGGTYVRMENIAEEPTETFKMDTGKLAAAYRSGRISALIHSHPDGVPWPSETDMRHQIDSAKVWAILVVEGDGQAGKRVSKIQMFGDQVPMAPLMGREFIPGVYDCYNLLRDIYREELGVTLDQMPRDANWWEEEDIDLLCQENFEAWGFFPVEKSELKPYDVVVGSILASGKLNHCAVYRGNGLVAHHLIDRLSREEAYQPWDKYARVYLRHKSQA